MEREQALCRAAMERYGMSREPMVRALDAASEVGELAKEILKASDYGARPVCATEGMAEEAGDCLFAVLNLCDVLGIDAGAALGAALLKYEARFAARGEICSGR